MADIGKLIKDQIRSVTARQIRADVVPLRKEVRNLKRDLGAQRRLTRVLERTVSLLNQGAKERRTTEIRPSKSEVQSARLRPETIKRLRTKLGLSRDDFSTLLGVSANAVYLWESAKATPRTKARTAIIEIRKMGVREARRRLEERVAQAAPA